MNSFTIHSFVIDLRGFIFGKSIILFLFESIHAPRFNMKDTFIIDSSSNLLKKN